MASKFKKRIKIECPNCGKVFESLPCYKRKYCCFPCSIEDRPEFMSKKSKEKMKKTMRERFKKGLIWQNRKKK